MATKKGRSVFTAGAAFVVNKPFRFGGKTWDREAQFPWRKLGCSVRRLRQLHDGNFVVMADTAAKMIAGVTPSETIAFGDVGAIQAKRTGKPSGTKAKKQNGPGNETSPQGT